MKVTVKTLCCFVMTLLCGIGSLSAAQQWKDTIVVARDGTGDYRTLTEAMEGIRAFMDYKVTVLVKKGVYKEKVVLPSWLENVDFIGENVENTIITYDDHANINKMGTFRTYTLKVEGSSITFRIGAGCCASYGRRPSGLYQLPFSGKPGYRLHRCERYPSLFSELLYRGYYRFYLWSFYRIIQGLHYS